jgi:hypothetical protein
VLGRLRFRLTTRSLEPERQGWGLKLPVAELLRLTVERERCTAQIQRDLLRGSSYRHDKIFFKNSDRFDYPLGLAGNARENIGLSCSLPVLCFQEVNHSVAVLDTLIFRLFLRSILD